MIKFAPEIPNKIKKLSIFPPFRDIEIIDIHRLMMSGDILPATIIRAENKEMKLLRDISLALSMMYISKDDKVKYIAKYFKVSEDVIKSIIKNVSINHYDSLIKWQELLKEKLSINIAWDLEKSCPLEDMQRLKEFFPISNKYEWFEVL